MSLESLLASLKHEVSGVSEVQASNGAALRRYPTQPDRGISETRANTGLHP